MILNKPQERLRFIRFTVVGTIGAIVDFGVFNLLISFFKVLPVWANVLSFSVAVINNFIWNRYWTYPDSRSKRKRRQMTEFLIVNAIGVLIRTPIFTFLENPMYHLFVRFPGELPLRAEFLGHNAALAFAMVVVLFWNFYINRYWTYADVR